MEQKIKGHFNKKICSDCGGKCCKFLPGCMFPEDFKEISKENILGLLTTGNFSIDSWVGDIRPGKDLWDVSYFLRPATKGNEGKIYDESWGGKCVFLRNTGCLLSDNKKPFGCRILEPKENLEGKCKTNNGDKKDSVLAWVPYRDIFEEIINKSEFE